MRVFILAVLCLFFLSPAFAMEDYICPMHPHVHGKKGETCPICGMALVPAAPQNREDEDLPKDALRITPEYLQALGVKSEKAAYRSLGRDIHSYGRIIPVTRNEYHVSPRKSGWIKDLHASATGDAVKKGDVLFTLYSPDIILVQSEYLTGLKSGFRPGASEERLRLFGMDEQAIALFKQRGVVMENIPFHAPADGGVATLNARKGGYVMEGAIVLTIQDYSQVWVETHVLVKDLPFLKPGMSAVVTAAQSSESFSAAIDYIYPTADPASREGIVRLVLDNPGGKLKTDQAVSVMFEAEAASRLAVPEQSVLKSGMGAYVFEDMGQGRFRPLMVETGITSGGFTEITSGLAEGRYIVTSGQFMLDAESNLQGGMAHMHGADASGAKGGEGHVHGK